jgi:YidC/Oxa1 family membrane protein insertase
VETRALIAFVLSIAILVGYQFLLGPRHAGRVEPTATTSQHAEDLVEHASPTVPVPAAVVAKPTPTTDAERITVDRDHYRLVLTSAGGRLESFRLHAYREDSDSNSPALDMVHTGGPLPLAVYWTRSDGGVSSDLGLTYSLGLSEEADGRFSIELTAVGPDGERIRKHIGGGPESYALDYDVEVTAPYETSIGVGWSSRVPEGHDRFMSMEGPSVYLDGALEHIAASELADPVTRKGQVDWAGYADHYFLAAYYPNSTAALRFSAAAAAGTAESTLWSDGPTQRVSYGLYIGPKKLAELRRVGHQLEGAVDLGWFAFVARPMLELMLLLNKFTGNYGWSIILLTVGVRLVFYPINKRQALAMKAMQRIQPELKKIQEKFKDDRERLNREVMEVYRRHKVNPLAGCLPMVLQLPVFLGLYNALMQSIELRHAPFVGWITDLSKPDRLGTLAIPFVMPPGVPVLTILMGASMIIQQRMMPAAGDPAQQKMMMLMPLVFTVMFINFPSGLVLYWFASNVMSIGQQYLTNRLNG